MSQGGTAQGLDRALSGGQELRGKAARASAVARHGLMSADYKESSYWLDDLPAWQRKSNGESLPKEIDVLVIGSGYTGLNAAIQTARGGRSTLVLDLGDMGQGCSTRNGGQISTSIKPSLEELTKRCGAERAEAVRQEGRNALSWIEAFAKEEGIDCDFKVCGRFHAAHSPQHYEALLKSATLAARSDGIDFFDVPRAEQQKELGSPAYFGGVVYPKHASLHPAKFHRGLLEKAEAQVVEAFPCLQPLRRGGLRGLRKCRAREEPPPGRGELPALERLARQNSGSTLPGN